MEKVRCKVRLTSVTQSRFSYGYGANVQVNIGWTASFQFVSPNESEENKRFWEATPSGKFEIQTNKEMPWEIGKEYYVDVTPAK